MSDNENGNEELYFHEDPPVKKGRGKRKATATEEESVASPVISRPKVARKRLEGQNRVIKKIAKANQLDEELNKDINPFQSPSSERPSQVQKLPKIHRKTATKKGADKIAVLRANSPKLKRSRIQLEEEQDDLSENGEDSEDGEVDENSKEFVQDLANRLVGDEDISQFTDKQRHTEVTDQFSGVLMSLERILIVRKKLFDWRQDGLAKAALAQQQVNQVVKKLEQEFQIANASAPVNMEQAKLINSDLHDSLQILFFAEVEPNGDHWLEDYDDQSWKNWKPELFFERVFRIFPPHSASREGTLQHKLSKLVYRFDSSENFKSLNDFFAQVNAICKTFGNSYDDMGTIVRTVLDKIKASGEVGKTISENLKEGGQITSIMDM